MFAALIGATLGVVKFTTDYLLHRHAVEIAQRWAKFVVQNVDDLEQIAAGQRPTTKSMAFFEWSLREGVLYRYEIFNPQGYSQLVSDQHQTALVDVSEFEPAAAAAARTGTMSAAAREGGPGNLYDLPDFFAEAYVPVIAHGRPIAVVAAYVDQTDERNRVFHTFMVVAAGLCALTSFAFLLPAAAWYQRTVEKDRAYAEIRFLAKHDAMTRLSNRTHLIELMTEALDRASRTDALVAVHYLDLDNFKHINDRLGQHAGDAVIRLMGERLGDTSGPGDIVARMGSDEFVIVQTGIANKHDAESMAQRLMAAMAHPFLVAGRTVPATASVGIALAPEDGWDPERLVRVANLALHKSKDGGRNCYNFFTADLDTELQARLAIEARVREAAERGEFDLHYQPLVAVADERTCGYEALLRLDAADGTPIPPAKFIPIAEEIGLIREIGAWVIRQACMTAAAWPDRLTIAVNLSPMQFDGTVCDVVRAALEASGLAPARLQLEITESLLMDDTDAVMSELTQLKMLGVAIVMDDFGTGYSSLSYLWRFPFSKIKIDRAFIQNLDSADTPIETIVRTIIRPPATRSRCASPSRASRTAASSTSSAGSAATRCRASISAVRFRPTMSRPTSCGPISSSRMTRGPRRGGRFSWSADRRAPGPPSDGAKTRENGVNQR